MAINLALISINFHGLAQGTDRGSTATVVYTSSDSASDKQSLYTSTCICSYKVDVYPGRSVNKANLYCNQKQPKVICVWKDYVQHTNAYL